jgi:8-hydroxy-5-deazaflavin:NADPH oxidoreductase
MKIAIIGAGNVGKTLGAALRAKGHTVLYGSRDPAKTNERNAKTVADALAGAEAVILATPWTATEALVCEHADELAGKIVIDATNPINPNLTRLALGFDTSGAELLQSQARKARFFKAFNSTGVSVMAKPHFAEGNALMFVAGPGGADKKTVLRIVADVGFEAVDAGELKAARLLEPLAMLWIQLALLNGHGSDFAFVMARRDAANRNADPRVRMVHPHPQEAE